MPTHLPVPANFTPADQLGELAAILAAGVLRLRWPAVSPATPAIHGPQKFAESTANELATAAEPSVTGHAG